MLFLSHVSRPVVWLLSCSSNLVLRPFGDRTTFSEARLSAEELEQLVEEAGKAGSLAPPTAEIASRALAFRDLTAADVMVPRNHIQALPLDAAPEELKRLLLEEGRSRMPVYKGTPEEIVGYVILGEAEEPERAVEREPSGAALVRGDLPVRDANRALGLELPEGEDYTSVAGLCVSLAGAVPERGTRLTTSDGTALKIVEASPRLVRRVRITPPPAAPPEEA